MTVDPGGKATCVKADTLGLPSDHILNYAIFDVVMELVYLLINTKHFETILAYGYMYISIHTIPLQNQ